MPGIALHELMLKDDDGALPNLIRYVEGHSFQENKKLGSVYISNLTNTSQYSHLTLIARVVSIYGRRGIPHFRNDDGTLPEKEDIFFDLNGAHGADELKAIAAVEENLLQEAEIQKVFHAKPCDGKLGKVTKGKDGLVKCVLDKQRFRSSIVPYKETGKDADKKKVWDGPLFSAVFKHERADRPPLPTDYKPYRTATEKQLRTCLLDRPDPAADSLFRLNKEDVTGYQLFRLSVEPYCITYNDMGANAGFQLKFRINLMTRIPEAEPMPQPVFGEAAAAASTDADAMEWSDDGSEVDPSTFYHRETKKPKARKPKEYGKQPKELKEPKEPKEPKKKKRKTEEVKEPEPEPEPAVTKSDADDEDDGAYDGEDDIVADDEP